LSFLWCQKVHKRLLFYRYSCMSKNIKKNILGFKEDDVLPSKIAQIKTRNRFMRQPRLHPWCPYHILYYLSIYNLVTLKIALLKPQKHMRQPLMQSTNPNPPTLICYFNQIDVI
jgi:hypothetical protein